MTMRDDFLGTIRDLKAALDIRLGKGSDRDRRRLALVVTEAFLTTGETPTDAKALARRLAHAPVLVGRCTSPP